MRTALGNFPSLQAKSCRKSASTRGGANKKRYFAACHPLYFKYSSFFRNGVECRRGSSKIKTGAFLYIAFARSSFCFHRRRNQPRPYTRPLSYRFFSFSGRTVDFFGNTRFIKCGKKLFSVIVRGSTNIFRNCHRIK